MDAPNAEVQRFPPSRIAGVEIAIRSQLAADDVDTLVCAAACGADLLALSAAAALGLRRRIVLPFSIEVFKERSVADRPADYPWSDLYDRFIREARAADDLRLLQLDSKDPAAFTKTNEAILDEALSLARGRPQETEALAVWDGRLRTRQDYTEHFAREAQRRHMNVKSIAILDAGGEG